MSSGFILWYLAFRDYLESHEEAREQYGKLKEALAEQFPHDIDGYMDGKDDFIKGRNVLQ
ncbi:GrpB family protein [Lacicoccus alkaliphilus]|nr:GrpB family protein [Salinicoccus alkaliphilus]